MSLALRNKHQMKYVGVKEHNICNLLSNGSGKKKKRQRKNKAGVIFKNVMKLVNLINSVYIRINCSIYATFLDICAGVYSVAQSYLTLCDLMDCSPPGSSVHWIFQARILEWVAVPSSRGSSQPRDPTHVS